MSPDPMSPAPMSAEMYLPHFVLKQKLSLMINSY